MSLIRRALKSRAVRWRRPPRMYLASMSTRPISTKYGFDRGKSADRRYIEQFLAEHAQAIRGRCIEVKDDSYARRFGAGRVSDVDVLDIDSGNDRATVVADLQNLESVADATYDCAIVTQTLQYLGDPRRGVSELHRILAPGGTALVTIPCLGRVEPGDLDRWRFMPKGAADLFADLSWEVQVQTFGNVLLGVAMWTGMAVEDIPRRAWQIDDPVWPCVIGVRATKPQSHAPTSHLISRGLPQS